MTRGGGSVNSLVPRIDLTRPLNGLVYPFLGVAVLVAVLTMAIGFGTGVLRPLFVDLVGQLPVVGGSLRRSGGQASFDLEVPV